MAAKLTTKEKTDLFIKKSQNTSILCPNCGYIHKDNRPNQEEFICQECGYFGNCDFLASLKIKDRLSVDVLRTSLLNKNEFGSYEPKKCLSKQSIFNILHSYYSSNNRTNDLLTNSHFSIL